MSTGLIGKRYGRLVIVGRVTKDRVKAACDCGIEVVVWRSNLITGNTRSCGCLRREHLANGGYRVKHGATGSPEYRSWTMMLNRCLNPQARQWRHYGGRGIKVCSRWRAFACSLADMGRRPSLQHSIERIDNNGGYDPGNCKWATRREQMLNTRRTVRVRAFGENLRLDEWASRTGIPYRRLSDRIRKGWEPERALTQPMRRWPSEQA